MDTVPLFTLGALGVLAFALAGDDMDTGSLNEIERARLSAFLALLRHGEGGPEGYNALVYGGRFHDMSDHPAITGEWAGQRRPDGRLTTAAGAYQITRTTWLDIGGRVRFGSFDPQAQDAAAVRLMQRRGALAHVLSGQPEKAAYALRDEWEMFTLEQWAPHLVAARFVELGGTLA